jgi:hypothetical protein
MRKRLLSSEPGMRMQTRDQRLSPAERLQRRIACKPLEYTEAWKDGGGTGRRSPEERTHLVLAFAIWVQTGIRIEDPDWFKEKFPKYPAYEFTLWERCIIGGCPYLKTQGFSQAYCLDLSESDKKDEIRTLEIINAESLGYQYDCVDDTPLMKDYFEVGF